MSTDSVQVTAASLRIKIFADGADKAAILELAKNPLIRGFTTNPTLMRRAGVSDYETFGREVAAAVGRLPVSFEVLSDDFGEMEAQARQIASWGDNVFVKIPVTNAEGRSSAQLLGRLARAGVKVNVTAITSLAQMDVVLPQLAEAPPGFVSIFAGRIADTGRDPTAIIRGAMRRLRRHPHLELIWASPREVFNIVQADRLGCHVITVTHDLLRKLPLLGMDLDRMSLDTVQMFLRDGRAAEYHLDRTPACPPPLSKG